MSAANKAISELASKLQEYSERPNANAAYIEQQRKRLEAIAWELEFYRAEVEDLAQERSQAYNEGVADTKRRIEAAQRPGRNALIHQLGYEGYRELHNGAQKEKWADHYQPWVPDGRTYRMKKDGSIEPIN